MRLLLSKYEEKIEGIFKNANTGTFSSDSILLSLPYHPSILSVRRRITNQEVVVELGEACTEVHLCDLLHRDDCLLHRQLADEVGQEHLQILCRLLQTLRRLLLLLLLRGRRK